MSEEAIYQLSLIIALAIYGIILAGGFIAEYILFGAGLKRMLRGLGHKKPNYAFLPFLRHFALGQIAEVYDDGRPQRPLGRNLLIFTVLWDIISISYTAFLIINVYVPFFGATDFEAIGDINVFIENYSEYVERIPRWFSFVREIFGFVFFAFRATILFRVYAAYSPRNAFWMAIVSILGGDLAISIMLFVLRNKPAQRMRWQTRSEY